MRTTLENNLAFGLRQHGSKYGAVKLTLTGDYTVTVDGPTLHFLNGGSSDRNVALPTLSEYGGQLYFIINEGANLAKFR